MPDGTETASGGWNRILIETDDLESLVDRVRANGVTFRDEILSGLGGRQIVADDPDGNAIGPFEPDN